MEEERGEEEEGGERGRKRLGRKDGSSSVPCSVILVSDNSDPRISHIPRARTIDRVRCDVRIRF